MTKEVFCSVLNLSLLASTAIAALYEGFSLIHILNQSPGEGEKEKGSPLIRKITILTVATAFSQLVTQTDH